MGRLLTWIQKTLNVQKKCIPRDTYPDQRAFAVIGIIIYHLNAQWLSGGFLGVDTFFVISGYLITSLLISEYYRTQKIDLLEFWKRRLKRLIPAVLFLICVVLTFTLIFKPELIIQMKRDAIAAIFYVSNWWYISQKIILTNLLLNHSNIYGLQPLKNNFTCFSHWLSRSYYIDLNREILFKRYLLYR